MVTVPENNYLAPPKKKPRRLRHLLAATHSRAAMLIFLGSIGLYDPPAPVSSTLGTPTDWRGAK